MKTLPEPVIEIKSVAVIGLGLLGSSLGLAMADLPYHRLGWTRRKEVRLSERDKHVIDETNDSLANILGKADLTILCLPIPQIIEFCQANAQFWKPGTIVSDVGSVKEVIVKRCEPVLAQKGVHFIGGHPMAGTEKTGPEAALKHLYENATVFLTPTEKTNHQALKLLEDFWLSLKTKPVSLDVHEHDILVAHTSHISHILALALTQTVLDSDDEKLKQLRFLSCASGFRDTSRITSSNPTMWRQIIENNYDSVLETVRNFEGRWLDLLKIIENKEFDQLEREFAKGKLLRDEWMNVRYKNC